MKTKVMDKKPVEPKYWIMKIHKGERKNKTDNYWPECMLESVIAMAFDDKKLDKYIIDSVFYRELYNNDVKKLKELKNLKKLNKLRLEDLEMLDNLEMIRPEVSGRVLNYFDNFYNKMKFGDRIIVMDGFVSIDEVPIHGIVTIEDDKAYIDEESSWWRNKREIKSLNVSKMVSVVQLQKILKVKSFVGTVHKSSKKQYTDIINILNTHHGLDIETE